MFTPLFIVSACTLLGHISASAIPMWELLSKEEKLSYLYSMFAYQVEEFCEFSELQDCNQDLLKHGLKTLKAISDDRLDAMDPYQRGASSIIWNSIMEGHTMKKVKVVASIGTTPKPNSYEDDPSSSDDLGSQGLASAKIDNVYKVLPPKGFIYVTPKSQNIESDLPEYRQPSNHLSSEDVRSNVIVPLTGPLVIRVHLDGTPVNDGADRIPQDEDLKQYKLSQLRLPAF